MMALQSREAHCQKNRGAPVLVFKVSSSSIYSIKVQVQYTRLSVHLVQIQVLVWDKTNAVCPQCMMLHVHQVDNAKRNYKWLQQIQHKVLPSHSNQS